MPVVTVRNVPEETHRALRLRAASHGRSTEAEIRAILEEVVRPAERIKVGSALAGLRELLGKTELEIVRDQTPARFASFE